MSDSSRTRRRELRERLFPQGVPKLWCPPLTHYRPDGGPDRPRMAAHLATLAPYAKGWLVPGSTGDAWELDGPEARQVLEYVLDLAPALGVDVLVGALKPDAGDARVALGPASSHSPVPIPLSHADMAEAAWLDVSYCALASCGSPLHFREGMVYCRQSSGDATSASSSRWAAPTRCRWGCTG